MTRHRFQQVNIGVFPSHNNFNCFILSSSWEEKKPFCLDRTKELSSYCWTMIIHIAVVMYILLVSIDSLNLLYGPCHWDENYNQTWRKLRVYIQRGINARLSDFQCCRLFVISLCCFLICFLNNKHVNYLPNTITKVILTVLTFAFGMSPRELALLQSWSSSFNCCILITALVLTVCWKKLSETRQDKQKNIFFEETWVNTTNSCWNKKKPFFLRNVTNDCSVK